MTILFFPTFHTQDQVVQDGVVADFPSTFNGYTTLTKTLQPSVVLKLLWNRPVGLGNFLFSRSTRSFTSLSFFNPGRLDTLRTPCV